MPIPRPFNSTRVRARARAVQNVSRSLLRCAKIFVQNCAIQRNVAQNKLVRVTYEKHAVQMREKLRKNSLGNYKSAALPTELCRQNAPESSAESGV